MCLSCICYSKIIARLASDTWCLKIQARQICLLSKLSERKQEGNLHMYRLTMFRQCHTLVYNIRDMFENMLRRILPPKHSGKWNIIKILTLQAFPLTIQDRSLFLNINQRMFKISFQINNYLYFLRLSRQKDTKHKIPTINAPPIYRSI